MDQHIQKMREDAEQERRERRQASHTTFVAKLIQSADAGAKMIHQVTKPTPEEEQRTSGHLRETRLEAR